MSRLGWVVIALVGCGKVEDNPDARPGDAPLADTAIDSTIDAPTCASPTGAVARWRAEQNATDSAGTYNGTTVGANFGFTPGKHGSAFLLDGVDDAVSVDDQEALWPSASFTLEAWVKTTSTAAGLVLTKYACGRTCPAGTSQSYFALAIGANGIPQFDLRPEADPDIATIKDSLGPINNGAWHHLAGVRDNTAAKMVLYVDGVERVSSNLSALQLGPMSDADSNIDLVTIGASVTAGSNALSSFLNGALDDVAIYSRALTASEITAIYAAPDGICP